MITNFDYLKIESKFSAFADVAISAEKIILMDPEASILNSRRAMEFALKWMYSVDAELERPYQDNLQSLMNAEDYRQIVGPDLWKRMDYIRRCRNNVAHSNKKLGRDEAMLCLENLFIYLDYIAYCYSDRYEERSFDKTVISMRIEKAKESKEAANATREELAKEQEKSAKQELDLQKLIAENETLKEELSARRQEQQQTYVPKPLDLSEYETRKLYIDSMLMDAGWTEGKDWINEVELPGMPNKSEVGYADYVLYDDMHRPLAVIEAKRTCVDVSKGRQQAKLYADLLEQKYKRRPVIFLTNGFETRIVDGQYPERKCAVIYSKRDLEKWFNLLTMRTSLKHVVVDKDIAGRYYQESAIKAVCNSFDEKNRRKALLVMATGSGKTRTVIALCDCLLKAGWVKNILFLADRNSLVTQAKRSFVNMLPNLSCTNLVEEKDNYNAHCVFSTYQTMMNCTDTVSDNDGKLFTCGHFDLVICDEAHRSIYNKYRDIFTYFDAPLVGLTATPKDEIDKNTYEVFELENGVPTYGYDLAQAVKDGYLVDYVSVESKLKFIEQGIVYDDLSAEDKEAYEDTFEDEHGELPEAISSSALNTWVFNVDTIKQVLNILMTDGIRIDYGQKLGKTIIFAEDGTMLKSKNVMIFQSIDSSKIHFFDREDQKITTVEKGHVYATGSFMKTNGFEEGDIICLKHNGVEMSFVLDGVAKDALLGSNYTGNTRFIMNPEDMQVLLDNKEIYEHYRGEICYIDTEDEAAIKAALTEVSNVGFNGPRSTIKMCYVMDMIVAFIILILSICLIIVSFVVLKFSITFTISEEFREIGVMKAIGLSNGKIRSLYITKYLMLASIGAVVGFFASVPFGNMLLKSVSENMVLGNDNVILINFIGSLLVVVIIVLFSYICTGKVKKSSPVDAIRTGQTGERYQKKSVLRIHKGVSDNALFMALNDILSNLKRFVTIMISFGICTLFVLILVNTTATMKSSNLIHAFGTRSDLYVKDVSESMEYMNTETKKSMKTVLVLELGW